MKVRYSLVDKLIKSLSSKHPELTKPPVKIEKLVKRLSIELIEKDFDYAMSGAAIIDGDNRIISINKAESPVRKRFTVAHELGHILLHYDQELNVDLKPIRLNRDSSSSMGESWREVEANYFAASILMPTEQIERYYYSFIVQYEDDDLILEKLAKKFKVSIQAMSIRLAKLELIKF